MNLQERLEHDLKEAMRASVDVRKRTIRMVISAIKLAQVEKGDRLDDAGILSIVQKEIKNRKDAAQEAQKMNRMDLVAENQEEIAVLEEYLPRQLSTNEVGEIVRATVQELGANGIGDMGKVMKALLPKIQGRAPGDLISKLVREILQG